MQKPSTHPSGLPDEWMLSPGPNHRRQNYVPLAQETPGPVEQADTRDSVEKAPSRPCRSDRITYLSEDKKREFVVTATGKAYETVRPDKSNPESKPGVVVWQFDVLKGELGGRTYYVVDEYAIKNTTGISPGMKPPTVAYDETEFATEPELKPTWRPWRESFRKGQEGFYISGGGAEEMLGSWSYQKCRK